MQTINSLVYIVHCSYIQYGRISNTDFEDRRSELGPVDTAIGPVLLGKPVVRLLEMAVAQEPTVRAERGRVLAVR